MLAQMLRENRAPVDIACLGIDGPVYSGLYRLATFAHEAYSHQLSVLAWENRDPA